MRSPSDWIGVVLAIRFPERTKPMLIRIDTFEIAPHSLIDKETQLWFFGRYA